MAQLSEATIQPLRDRETILAIISHRNEHGQSLTKFLRALGTTVAAS